MNVIRDDYPPNKQQYVAGAAAVNGSQNIITAPGQGYEIVVASIIVQNTTTNPTTVKLAAGSAVFLQALAQNQGDGIAVFCPRKMEYRLGDNNPLALILSGANSHNYNIGYWIESTR